MHHGHHQTAYLIFSVIVAFLGSWTALDLQRQVRAHDGRIRLYWKSGLAASMGLSIFAMHYISMLGIDVGVPVTYDLGYTLASLVLAIFGTAIAFMLVQNESPSIPRVAIGGILMGAAICGMHYIGMASMRIQAVMHYDMTLVGVSLTVAIVASSAALAISTIESGFMMRLLAAIFLGLAISSMHYIAMYAVEFRPMANMQAPAPGLNDFSVALWIGTGTMLILLMALLSAMFDRRFQGLAIQESEAVAESEAHLRDVLTRMPLGVIVVGRQTGTIVFANREAQTLIGRRSPTDILFLDLDGKALPKGGNPFARALRNGVIDDRSIVRMSDPEGKDHYVEITATSIPGNQRHGPEVVIMIQDVTGRAEAEQTLQQTQKLETIGQLTGGVAHDFNNLLTPIIGGLDMLLRKENDPRTQRILDGAMQAASRAATLVQRLLAFSRRQALQPKLIDIGVLLHGIHELIVRTIGPMIEVSIKSEEGLIAMVDPAQLELAIINLSVNARDAMPENGKLQIRATAENHDDSGGLPAGAYVKINVTDNGTGMTKEVARRAIEPFFSTKGIGKGTGLGLSMAHGLAAQSKGELSISSIIGVGTSIEIWLPLSKETLEPVAPKLKEEVINGDSALILLVDDEDLVRNSTAEMMRDMGYEVVTASSGNEGLILLSKRTDVKMVVTDYLMPGMTGAILASRITAMHPDMPILVITGYAKPEELPQELPRLAKPFSRDDLARKLVALRK